LCHELLIDNARNEQYTNYSILYVWGPRKAREPPPPSASFAESAPLVANPILCSQGPGFNHATDTASPGVFFVLLIHSTKMSNRKPSPLPFTLFSVPLLSCCFTIRSYAGQSEPLKVTISAAFSIHKQGEVAL